MERETSALAVGQKIDALEGAPIEVRKGRWLSSE